jgi:hypothetical protein
MGVRSPRAVHFLVPSSVCARMNTAFMVPTAWTLLRVRFPSNRGGLTSVVRLACSDFLSVSG